MLIHSQMSIYVSKLSVLPILEHALTLYILTYIHVWTQVSIHTGTFTPGVYILERGSHGIVWWVIQNYTLNCRLYIHNKLLKIDFSLILIEV